MWFAYITKILNLKPLFYKYEKIPFNQSVVSMDPRWKHPFPALVQDRPVVGKVNLWKKNSFVEGVPSDLESMINPSERNLVVIDDLMQELSNDPRITSLFTKGCHHRNLSVIFILQNIFHRGKELRDMSLNCHYLVLFKSPRDSSQINHLAKQMFPGHVKYMQQSFQDATSRPYGYLLCDLKPETPTVFRLRTNGFPGETQFAYVRKV